MKKIFDSIGNSVEIMGRVGIVYSDKVDTYFIDSELLVGEDYDLAIFKNEIRHFDTKNKSELNDNMKAEVLKKTTDILSLNGIKFLILD